MCENSPLHYLEELIELDGANGDKNSKGEMKQRQRLEDTRKEIKRRQEAAFYILNELLKICNSEGVNVKTFKTPFLILCACGIKKKVFKLKKKLTAFIPDYIEFEQMLLQAAYRTTKSHRI